MSIYTVYEPPLRAGKAAPDPERFVFVRDGFYFWAFIAAWLWLLWHRMWLVLLIYVVVAVGVEYALYFGGVNPAGIALVELLLSLLIGIEASTLRRFTLERRGWRNVGVVVGDDREDAEQRFFNAWVDAAGKPAAPIAAAPAPATSVPRVAPTSGIVGLFPEPGASR